jgi:hypothetical protein
MTILIGAVAYREDGMQEYQNEINSWALSREYQHVIACPKEANCEAIYRLVMPLNESDQRGQEYVLLVHESMEKEDCHNHSPRIRLNPPE